MNKKILQSVIKITQQHDVDSLEYGMLATLAELLTLKSVTLYKPVKEKPEDGIEKIISISVTDDKNNEPKYTWDDVISIVHGNKYLEQCLTTREDVFYTNINNDQVYLLNPIICGKQLIGAIEITGNEELLNHKELINGFARIYENYLFILNKSEKDKLTGLFNRHSFDVKLDRLLQLQRNKQKRENSSLNNQRNLIDDSNAWLLIIDIDHFKKVNDTYGHVCGDEVLLKLSQIMKTFFRSADLLFRFGGEEFVIILEPIPEQMATLTLERFRKTIAEYKFPLVDKLTISGGYIKITETDYPPTIIEQADQALYYAKEHGRNRICNFESLIQSGELSKSNDNGEVDLF